MCVCVCLCWVFLGCFESGRRIEVLAVVVIADVSSILFLVDALLD